MRKSLFLLLAIFAMNAMGEPGVTADGKPPTFTEKSLRGAVPYSLGLDVKRYQAKKLSRSASPSTQYLDLAGTYPADLDLRDTGLLGPIVDQGQCGSCVYNAGQACIFDNYSLAGEPVPGLLSRQFQMDCGKGWSCSGNLAEYFLAGVMNTGGSPLETAYKYRAQDQGCQGTSAPKYGNVLDPAPIDNSPKSVIAFINNPGGPKRTAMITAAASVGRFMSYSGGVLNVCARGSVDHQLGVAGYSCEDSTELVDGKKVCKFDANGKLPPGVGWWLIRNSWGTGYGEQGWLRIKMTDASGHLCNEIGDEVYGFGVKVTPKPVNGGWSPADFTGAACVGNVQKSKPRTCTNPEPANGGKACEGDAVATQSCTSPDPEPTPGGGGSFPWAWLFVAALVVALVGVLVFYRKKD